MRSRHAKWQAQAPVEDSSFHVRGLEAVTRHDPLVDYLAQANVRIAELEDTDSLRLRLTRFPELTFAHAYLPRAVVEWPRDTLSLERTVIVLCRSGRLDVRSEAPVLRRGPGLVLVPPGDTLVSFQARESLNEVLYISAPASLLHELDLSEHPAIPRSPVPMSALAPLYAFVESLSSVTVGESLALGPLHGAAKEVTRAIARLIAEGDPSELTLYSRALRLIVENYPDTRLTVPRLARLAGVPERTLQAAFAAEGTTVVKEIRMTRARAVSDLRQRNPRMSAAQLAATVGFGSVSSLHRAMSASEPVATAAAPE